MLACSHRSARIPARPLVEARSHVALQPGAAAEDMSELFSGSFPVPPFVSALLRGSCGARRLRSLCFAFGPVRFWLPRAGPPRKAASGLGSRAHSLPRARDRRAEQEKRMYLNRITLIG